MTMNKRITATVIIACMMLSLTSCSAHAKPTVMQTMESFGTFSQNPDSETVQSHITDDTMETVTLKGSEDDTYTFRYDSDIVTYSGQGGNFFLIGSSPTECYLHVMIQSNGSYEDALNTASGRIVEDYTLDSGRKAFCYKTSDANTYHIIIEANDIVVSGNGTVKITIGSADSWLYSRQDIANMVDKGF